MKFEIKSAILLKRDLVVNLFKMEKTKTNYIKVKSAQTFTEIKCQKKVPIVFVYQ